MALEDWMSAYPDKTLAELHMPGAHDAGTARDHINKTTFGTDSNAATQSLTILEQIKAGTRLFDVRLKKIKTGVPGFRKTKVVAHHTTAGQGATSDTSFDAVIGEAADWWKDQHRTEVLIFRISHTDTDTHVQDIIMNSGAGALHTGTGNLCDKKLKDIVKVGGGIICILDNTKFGRFIDQAKGIHSFSKFNGVPDDSGIAVCGQYKRTHKLNEVITTGLKAQYEHNTKHSNGDHLWHLYWQKTYTNPVSTTGIETGADRIISYDLEKHKVHGGTHSATDHMIKLMQGHARQSHAGYNIDDDYVVVDEVKAKPKKGIVGQQKVMYSTVPVRNFMLPNIFSYDFVTAEINQKIVDLNQQGMMQIADDSDD